MAAGSGRSRWRWAPQHPCWPIIAGVKWSKMSTYHIRPPTPPRFRGNRTSLLRVAVAMPVPSWFVFFALLSARSLSNSFTLGQAVWYTCATVLLLGVGVFVVWALLVLPTSGPASWPIRAGKGPPPQTPPLTGAPRPVPIRPTPRFVRSAAEPLPCEREKSA